MFVGTGVDVRGDAASLRSADPESDPVSDSGLMDEAEGKVARSCPGVVLSESLRHGGPARIPVRIGVRRVGA